MFLIEFRLYPEPLTRPEGPSPAPSSSRPALSLSGHTLFQTLARGALPCPHTTLLTELLTDYPNPQPSFVPPALLLSRKRVLPFSSTFHHWEFPIHMCDCSACTCLLLAWTLRGAAGPSPWSPTASLALSTEPGAEQILNNYALNE